MRVEVGDKVYTPFEQNPYTVRARDDRYIICTRPHRNTVLYFIIDLKRKWRAPDNMVFCSGYETNEDCQERLRELQCGELGLSQRMGIRLDINVE
jgi:hypothetical protein